MFVAEISLVQGELIAEKKSDSEKLSHIVTGFKNYQFTRIFVLLLLGCLLKKLGEFTMVSNPIRLILVDWLYAKRKPHGLRFCLFLVILSFLSSSFFFEGALIFFIFI